MVVKLINGEFHLISPKSNNHYVITKDLVCNCKAGTYKRFPCSHVKMVLEAINKGTVINNPGCLAKEQSFQGQRIMMKPEEAVHY